MSFLDWLRGRPHQPAPLPELFDNSEEGFRDTTFAIEGVGPRGDERLISAAAKSGAKRLAFAVSLGTNWTPANFGPDLPSEGYCGVVTIHSCGVESDALLEVLDQAYETGIAPPGMKQATRFAAISLGGMPHSLERGPTQIKLFFEPETEDAYEDGYAECYLNIDLPRRRLELREKDEDYRAPLIRALSRT